MPSLTLNIFRFVSRPLLYQTLFPNLEWFHEKNNWTEEFYFVPNSFPVKCEMEVVHYDHDPDLLQTVITGKIIENVNPQKLLRGVHAEEEVEPFFSGEISLEYTTNKKDKKLVQAESSITLWHEDGELFQKQSLALN